MAKHDWDHKHEYPLKVVHNDTIRNRILKHLDKSKEPQTFSEIKKALSESQYRLCYDSVLGHELKILKDNVWIIKDEKRRVYSLNRSNPDITNVLKHLAVSLNSLDGIYTIPFSKERAKTESKDVVINDIDIYLASQKIDGLEDDIKDVIDYELLDKLISLSFRIEKIINQRRIKNAGMTDYFLNPKPLPDGMREYPKFKIIIAWNPYAPMPD